MAARPRIALIHATPVAADPVRDAFAAGWPEAETANLLDDSLSVDRTKEAELSPALEDRIVDLGRYARRCGADAILYTCSAFGRAIERAARELDLPVLKPNEAMFEAPIAAGDRCGMVATFAPSVAGMEAEFAEAAARSRPSATCGHWSWKPRWLRCGRATPRGTTGWSPRKRRACARSMPSCSPSSRPRALRVRCGPVLPSRC